MAATMDSVCEFIVDTKHKTPKFTDDGYPCIRTPNIGRGYFILENAKYVSEESYQEWIERAVPSEGDLIFAREAPVGNVAIIPKGLKVCHGQRTVLIRPDKTKVDSHYLMYLMLGDELQNRMYSMASGATVPHLNMSDIRALELPELPPIEKQKELAGVLAAYDNLIENNNRRIAILEEMAQSLYREWFVKFRFPGHENAKFVDSPLGKIPEGWAFKPISELYKTSSGGTPSRKNPEYYGSDHWWVKTKELNDGFVVSIEEQISELGLAKSSAKLFPKDTVIIAMYGATIGKLGILTEEAATNQACCAFLPLEEKCSPWFIYLALLESRVDLVSLGQGAAQQNISQQVIKKYKIVVPVDDLLISFKDSVSSVFRCIELLVRKNKNLTSQREYVLPKIISGGVSCE